MENENKKLSFCEIIVYAMMAVAVVYVFVQSILGNNSEMHFKITLGIWILAAVVVSDFVAPMIDKRFEKVGDKAAMIYLGYAILDALAFTGVYIFIINVNMSKEPLHYIFLAGAVVLFVVKTLLYNKFQVESGKNMEAAFAEEEEPEAIIEKMELDPDDVEVDTLEEEPSEVTEEEASEEDEGIEESTEEKDSDENEEVVVDTFKEKSSEQPAKDVDEVVEDEEDDIEINTLDLEEEQEIKEMIFRKRD